MTGYYEVQEHTYCTTLTDIDLKFLLALKPSCVLNRVILKRKVDRDVITVTGFLLLINCLGPECSLWYIQGQGNSTERCFTVSWSPLENLLFIIEYKMLA